MKSNFGDRVAFTTLTQPDTVETGADEKGPSEEAKEFEFHFLPRDIKAHLDQIGDVFDQIRFSDSSRADENDILLGIFRLGCAIRTLLLQLPDVIDVVVVIADCNRENLLRFVLFDHKTIEMRFDVAWQKMKVEVLCLFRWAFLIGSRLDRVRLGERGKRNPVAKIRFHELGELRFQFFR